LAPGGHVGRFIIWTESAFKSLDNVFGTKNKNSRQKAGYRPPRNIVTNCDITRIINSREVQSKLRDKKKNVPQQPKKNPLKNLGAMARLNPYFLTKRRRALTIAQKNRDHRQERLVQKRKEKKEEAKKNPRKLFKKILLSPTIAPQRTSAEKGIVI